MAEESSIDKKSIAVRLIENTPLAIIVIGLFLVVTGAAGGWPRYGLNVTELVWRITLGLMGAITAGFGVLLYWRKDIVDRGREDLRPEIYGIKITVPEDRDPVPNRFEVRGTYQVKPSGNVAEVRVFELSPTSQKFYPKRKVTFDEKLMTWEASPFSLGGNPGDKRVITVAVMGKGGQALCEYFDQAGEESKKWPGIVSLTPDIFECDRITVKRV